MPGGVSEGFEKLGDADHFAVSYRRRKAARDDVRFQFPGGGAHPRARRHGARRSAGVTLSNKPRVEFTPPADGEYVVACEQLSYVSGPNEIYHLSVSPATGDFSIALAIDRGEAPAGGGTGMMATVRGRTASPGRWS